MMITSEIGEIIMKEFVRYASRTWTDLAEQDRLAYFLMAEVERVRYDRDKFAFMNGGVHGPFDV